MSRVPLRRRAIPLLVGLALAGCGKPAATTGHEGHDHGAHDHAGNESPVRFKEGSGLQLSAETSTAIGLQTGPVEERILQPVHELTASVFDAGPPARASALVSAALADKLAQHPPTEVKILAIHREFSSAVPQVEIVLALPGNPAVGSTLKLSLHGPASTGPTVPRSALLRTATGVFVYVVNGTSLLRTPVTAGASDGNHIEILDGLYAGDVVATAGVEQLWLTELRLTKGGGHSH